MTRSIVFKTKGKLDLRSIMTFGLNAKPNTGHPIGFFGTGLKYAIAILAREKIPVTIYIDGMKWTVDTELSKFRDKEVTEVFLIRNRGKLLPSHVKKLPFTTEFGKTWELWQAFRELESNTRDENGETYITDTDTYHDQQHARGHTCICIKSENFVQEYLDRSKTFLPGGLTIRSEDDDIQIFDKPSRSIYYRGIRALDLDEKERSELTYNILRPMELTEDRTLKDKFNAQYYISQYLAQHSKPEVIKKVITSPPSSFERSLNYSWGTPSKTFLDTVEDIGEDDLLDASARAVHRQYRPPKVKAEDALDWLGPLIKAFDSEHHNALDIMYDHKEETLNIFKTAHAAWLKERNNNASSTEAQEVDSSPGRVEETVKPAEQHRGSLEEDDEIPF